jgi:glyoxylase-like metal-dependent hydrolase (beta-lactamase superfamily II)
MSIDIVVLEAHNPGPLTGSGNHTYLIAGGRGEAALVDAGVGNEQHLGDLRAALDDRQATLTRVVVTHAHSDHAAGAPAVAQQHPGARFEKYPWPGQDSRAVDWLPLTDGQAIEIGHESFVVVHTPGHAPDHIALWHAASRAAFVGDLVIAEGSVMIPWSHGGNLGDYLRSLERLVALRPDVLYPAHGSEIRDPQAVLHAHLVHRRLRETQIIDALRRGDSTVPAITESIYHGLRSGLMAYASENVRAHLAKLEAEGRAILEHDRWTLA